MALHVQRSGDTQHTEPALSGSRTTLKVYTLLRRPLIPTGRALFFFFLTWSSPIHCSKCGSCLTAQLYWLHFVLDQADMIGPRSGCTYCLFLEHFEHSSTLFNSSFLSVGFSFSPRPCTVISPKAVTLLLPSVAHVTRNASRLF